MTKKRRLGAKTSLIVLLLLVVAAGLGVWFYTVGSQDDEGTCQRLLKHERTPAALGHAYQPDLTCAELGEAIERATTGERPGRHSLAQAQAMKDILVALADIADEGHSSWDRQITAPVSLALADYSSDTYEIMAPGSVDHLRHELPSEKAWEDDEGAHMAISASSLFRVMTSLSADPESYVRLRDSLTGRVARELPGAPQEKTEEALSPYPTTTSWVIGSMDAVAVAAREEMGQQKSAEWDKSVFTRLTERPEDVPSFDDDPAGFITGSWRATLPQQAPDDLIETLGAQSVEMTRAWATALGTNDTTENSLVRDARKSAFSAQRSALRDFRNS